jgi:hypothetical protein
MTRFRFFLFTIFTLHVFILPDNIISLSFYFNFSSSIPATSQKSFVFFWTCLIALFPRLGLCFGSFYSS